MQQLDVGEVAPIATTWWNVDGDAAEPSAIALTITPPTGAAIVKAKADMTGSESVAGSGVDDVWTYEQTATVVGLWTVTAVGTVDGNQVEQSDSFLVGADSAPLGPCEPWCSWADVEACGADDLSGIDNAAREVAIDVASEILWNLSERVYSGLCTTTRSLCFACVSCAPSVCACQPRRGINLGARAPVWAVRDVVIDGATLDPSAYQLRGQRWLVRVDGSSWPHGIDVDDPDAFRLTWVYGRLVPVGGRRAAALYAREIAKQCTGQPCDLPAGTRTVNREGLTYQVVDPDAVIEEGKTGLNLVDVWLEADKRGRVMPARIFDPGAAASSRMRG